MTRGSENNLRILFITGGSPWPVHLGVNQRTNLLLRALQQCGAVDTVIFSRYAVLSEKDLEYLGETFGVVAYFSFQIPGERPPWRWIGRLCPPLAARLGIHLGGMGLWYRPQADIAQWLSRRVAEHRYDLIVGRYLNVLASSGGLAYRPIILDLDDYDCSTQRSRLQRPELSRLRRLAIRRQARQVERVVPGLLRRCDHIWVPSHEDQALLPSLPTSVLPNVPFDADGTEPAPCPPRPQSQSILMIGSLCHTVNVNAIDRFVQVVWPRIHANVPGSEFRIVGYGMSEEQKHRWGAVAGVVPVGFVEDVREEYERCAFTVVPIFEGGGTKIKVLESLRYGRTLVAVSHSCRGYGTVLRHLEAVWVAEDEEALVQGCTRLLVEPALRDRMAQAGCRTVREHYNTESFQRIVQETVQRVAVWPGGVQRRPSMASRLAREGSSE